MSYPDGYGADPAGPYGAYGYEVAAPAPGARRSPMMPLLVSVAAVLLLATAVLSTLYVRRSGDYDAEKKTAAARQEQVDTLSGDLKKVQDELTRTKNDLASTKKELGDSQTRTDELTRQHAVISKCIRLLGEAGEAAAAGNTALAEQKRTEYTPICNEAEIYLD